MQKQINQPAEEKRRGTQKEVIKHSGSEED
jgi:hypothetical protein